MLRKERQARTEAELIKNDEEILVKPHYWQCYVSCWVTIFNCLAVKNIWWMHNQQSLINAFRWLKLKADFFTSGAKRFTTIANLQSKTLPCCQVLCNCFRYIFDCFTLKGHCFTWRVYCFWRRVDCLRRRLNC